MRCLCGYDYVAAAIEGQSEADSYAVIRDEDYRTAMRLEAKCLRARGKAARLRTIARSAQYVGTAKVCPACQRLCLMPADCGPARFYQLDELG